MIFLLVQVQLDFSPDILEKAAVASLDLLAASDADLTLVLTTDEEIQKLNRDFLKKDFPTDVLSFPADEVDPDTGHRYLGDVIISLPRAAAQASAHGHDLKSEIQLLVVHGILHLLGHDHAKADEKTRMWQKQAEILERLGVMVTQVDD